MSPSKSFEMTDESTKKSVAYSELIEFKVNLEILYYVEVNAF